MEGSKTCQETETDCIILSVVYAAGASELKDSVRACPAVWLEGEEGGIERLSVLDVSGKERGERDGSIKWESLCYTVHALSLSPSFALVRVVRLRSHTVQRDTYAFALLLVDARASFAHGRTNICATIIYVCNSSIISTVYNARVCESALVWLGYMLAGTRLCPRLFRMLRALRRRP